VTVVLPVIGAPAPFFEKIAAASSGAPPATQM
jgi:hypothetical protein